VRRVCRLLFVTAPIMMIKLLTRRRRRRPAPGKPFGNILRISGVRCQDNNSGLRKFVHLGICRSNKVTSGPVLTKLIEGFTTAGRFAHQLHVGLICHQPGDSVAGQWMIVSQENAD
jgi:hypothetical protein